MKTITTEDATAVRKWLDHFAACVRARDIDAGKALFDPGVLAFGTRAESAQGLDELAERQWRPIWTSTSGFHFVDESVSVIESDDGSLAVALARWESTGFDAGQKPFGRRGRCTIALRRDPVGAAGWRAVHTHFSMWR